MLCPYPQIQVLSMPIVANKTEQTLAQLKITRPEKIAELFAEVRARFDGEAAAAKDEATWKTFRDAWLGRKSGALTRITDNWLKPASAELKRAVGRQLNELRAHVEAKIEERRAAIESGAEQAALARERIDLSLPGVIRPVGSRHIIRQVFEEIERIFVHIGFTVVEGPEIETPYYNFEALNIPEFHPVLEVQRHGLDRALRRRHGGPRRVRLREIRHGQAQRFRLRHGSRPHGHAEVRHRRHPGAFPERRALPAPVPLTHFAARR